MKTKYILQRNLGVYEIFECTKYSSVLVASVHSWSYAITVKLWLEAGLNIHGEARNENT